MAEQAYSQAVEDIVQDLTRQGKCFLAFHSELNSVMDELVEEYSQEQLNASRL